MWILQLHQQFDPAVPNKGLLIKSIIGAQFSPSVNYEILIEELISNPRKIINSELNVNVALKIFAVNPNFPCYAIISRQIYCKYCSTKLSVVKKKPRKCIVYDNINPGLPGIVFRKSCTKCSTMYLYGEHITKDGMLVDDLNRLSLELFKSSEETYF